jgi:hypothetical protein
MIIFINIYRLMSETIDFADSNIDSNIETNTFVESMKILLDPIFRSNEHSLLASCPTNLKVIIISPEILKLPSHQKLIIFMTPRCPLFQLRRLSLIICEKLTPTPQSIVSCIY